MARREAYLLAGPTASGKSAAAALLARRMGAAILSADSMLVYKGMDVGTAKPSRAERVEFDMGGIDLVTPADHFSSGAWLRAAARWLAAMPAGRPVVIVGGTGLYFSALLRGLDRKWTLPPPTYPVLQLDRAVLHARIAARLDEMFMQGLAAEVAGLRRLYPVWSDTASAASRAFSRICRRSCSRAALRSTPCFRNRPPATPSSFPSSASQICSTVT